LEAGQAVLLKAYQKQKALDIFKNKTVWQERKEEELWEQKSLDYLNLITRWGKY
jgi:flagellar biosynthesis chaperone FliJ